ncbi:MAG TPA: head GIN domain-containing protein [Telluria sp.]|nr:head GIN domain-containing protein [Telluria sp.]
MTTPRLTRRLAASMLALAALAAVAPATDARSWGMTQGSGTFKTETRAPGHFTGLSMGLPGSLELRTGASESVTIETDDNLMPLIETVVENGVLKIRTTRRNAGIEPRRLKIVVQTKGIDQIALGGSGSIDADALRGSKAMIDLGGSGSITLRGVDSDALTVVLGGSGDLKVAGGATKKLSLSIAGSGNVDLGKLQSADASVNIAGSGEATISVRDNLNVSIAGSGDVNYYGDPRVSKTSIGSGTAKRLGAAR